jgi:hypothetical protein
MYFLPIFYILFRSFRFLAQKDFYDHLTSGADSGGGGAPGARPPPKIGKNMIFWRKIVIFHTKYPNIFRASLRNWKEYDFLA